MPSPVRLTVTNHFYSNLLKEFGDDSVVKTRESERASLSENRWKSVF
jgi:hypothetical protein